MVEIITNITIQLESERNQSTITWIPGTAGSYTPLVMASILLNLNCLILGPNIGRPFRVNISRDESIDALKDAIKEKKKPKLDHTPDELDIWMAGDLMHNVPAMADNLWCDTFTAPKTPFKGRNSAEIWPYP